MDADKRYFIALPISGDLLDQVKLWQKNHFGWPVRWLEAGDFHITVMSPWQEEDVPGLISRLEKFVEAPRDPIVVKFSKIVFGPNRVAPRLIWAEGQAPVALLELKNRLEQALAKPDNRFYRLHLTLARFLLEDFGPNGLPLLFDTVEWSQTLSKLALFESSFDVDGPHYRCLKEFELKN